MVKLQTNSAEEEEEEDFLGCHSCVQQAQRLANSAFGDSNMVMLQ